LEEEHVEMKIVNEEYKIWKKNSVFLYDLLYGYTHLIVLEVFLLT